MIKTRRTPPTSTGQASTMQEPGLRQLEVHWNRGLIAASIDRIGYVAWDDTAEARGSVEDRDDVEPGVVRISSAVICVCEEDGRDSRNDDVVVGLPEGKDEEIDQE